MALGTSRFLFNRGVPRSAVAPPPPPTERKPFGPRIAALLDLETEGDTPPELLKFRHFTPRVGVPRPTVLGSGGFGIGGAASVVVRKRVAIASGGLGAGFPLVPVWQRTISVSGGFGVGGTAGPKTFKFASVNRGGFGVGGGAGPFAWTRVFVTGGVGIGFGDIVPSRTRRPADGSGGFGVGGAASVTSRIRSIPGTGGLAAGYGNVVVIRKKVVVVGSDDLGGPVSSSVGSKAGFGVGGGAGGIQKTQSGSTTGTSGRQKVHRGPFSQKEVLDAVLREVIARLGERNVYIATDPSEVNPNPPSESFCVLTLGGGVQDQQELTGGGRLSDVIADQLEFRVYARISTDQHRRNTFWTLDQRRGATERARNFRDTLQLVDVMDDSGYLVLAQPLRSFIIGQPGEDKRVPNHGFIPVRFEAVYTVYLGD